MTRGNGYPDDTEDDEESHESQDCSFKPQLAVFDVEAHFDHVSQNVWVARQLLARASAYTCAECTKRADDGQESTECEICYGRVPIKSNKRRLILWESSQKRRDDEGRRDGRSQSP